MVSPEDSLPDVWMAASSLGRARWRTEYSLVSFLIKTLMLLDQGPTHMTSFNPNCLHNAPSSNTVTSRIGASTHEFWEGHKHSVLNTEGKEKGCCGEREEEVQRPRSRRDRRGWKGTNGSRRRGWGTLNLRGQIQDFVLA